MIVAVKYNKISGEYLIKYRDPVSGNRSVNLANRLTVEEVEFITHAKHFYECDIFATWC